MKIIKIIKIMKVMKMMTKKRILKKFYKNFCNEESNIYTKNCLDQKVKH